jgi:hypothetical protein
VLYCDYAEVLKQPREAAERVARALDCGLDAARMAAAIDPALYRNRGQ